MFVLLNQPFIDKLIFIESIMEINGNICHSDYATAVNASPMVIIKHYANIDQMQC